MPVVLHGGARAGLLDLVPLTPKGTTIVYERAGFGRLPGEEYVVTDELETLASGTRATIARFVRVHGE